MIFAPDTEVSLRSVVNLLNTNAGLVDRLETVGDLDYFLDTERFTGPRARNLAELRSIRQLRSQLHDIWVADEDTVVRRVNAILRNAQALPQLIKHDEWDYHLHATTQSAPLYDRMAVEAAMAIAEVVRAKGLPRLRICASDDCQAALVDLSRNRSKMYCDTGNCANREHVRAYRARRAREN